MTLEILSVATSAFDCTISNHKLQVLPCTFMLLHTMSWFYAVPWSMGDPSSEMFWKYSTISLKYWIILFSILVGIKLIHENLRNDSELLRSVFSLFFFLLSSSHPIASRSNLL